jgi:hypothetical protein
MTVALFLLCFDFSAALPASFWKFNFNTGNDNSKYDGGINGLSNGIGNDGGDQQQYDHFYLFRDDLASQILQ